MSGFDIPLSASLTGYTNPIHVEWNSLTYQFEFTNFEPICTGQCMLPDGTASGTSREVWVHARTILPNTSPNSLSFFMLYVFEKWFVALPLFYGWMYLQRFFGLKEWCDLEISNFGGSTAKYQSECFAFSFIAKTYYLLSISTWLMI